jgi:glycosyltransferase involved in cell wall biosynthesis
MRILVAHNFYQQPGGEDQCVASEVAMLKAYGHEVAQYCLHNDSIDALSRAQVASRTIWSRSAYREIRELFRKLRPQIVHFHNTFPLISPAAYYAARAENVRVVQTLHNFRILCPNALFFRNGQVCEDCLGKSIPWPSVVHKCYRGSRTATATTAAMLTAHRMIGTWQKVVDAYIALTEFGRQKFIKGGLPADKIVVKSNFVYPESGTGAGTGGFGVFVGRLSAEKGLDTLLKAWNGLRGNVPLKIVGDGPMAPMVAAAAANDSRIEWLGRKSKEEVSALVGEATFLVCPSNCYETFGLVIVEAFAKGTPVIASNLGAMAELVDHGRTGFHFKPGNAIDLASTVQRLLADVPALHRMRHAARTEFELKYTVKRNYQALMDIYRQVLGSEIEQNDTIDDATHLSKKVIEC